MFYRKLDNNMIVCDLCPKHCLIKEGEFGFCGVRKNIDGKLYTLNYGKPAAISLDPIEKKPMYHFLPGEKALSIGTVGCNLACLNCQNFELSRTRADEVELPFVSPEEIVQKALDMNVKIIAYTYNEPTVFFEYALDIMKLAHKNDLKNVIVSNGYISPEALSEWTPYLDGANIDLKFFTDEKYFKVTSGHLNPILETLKSLKRAGVWFEITNLLIPNYNDDKAEISAMVDWIKNTLGGDTVLHFSRFFPMYKMQNVEPTPLDKIVEAYNLAKEKLNFVYAGNIPHTDMDNTYCPKCGKLLIERVGFDVVKNNIVDGKCRFCGAEIPGVFADSTK